MKWPLVKSKFYINKLFSQQLSHLLIDSIWKEPILTVPGIWPLCYSWIGYLQANGPPWVLLSFYVDHDFSCRQSEAANNSNLKSYWLLPDTVNCLLVTFLQKSAVYCLFLLNYPLHHGQVAVKSLPPWRCHTSSACLHSWLAYEHDVLPIPTADWYCLSSSPTQNTPVPLLLLQPLRFLLCHAL